MLKRACMRVFNTRIGLWITKIIIGPDALFLCYPVESRFSDYFTSKKRQDANTWEPYLIGIFWQGKTTSLIFAVSATESLLRDPSSTQQLKWLVSKMQKHAKFFSVDRVSFAGILPSLLRYRRLKHDGVEVEVTCKAVLKAIQTVICEEESRFESIVVLGGRGYIGRRLVAILQEAKPGGIASIDSLDKGDTLFAKSNALYVNSTLPGVIEANLSSIPSGTTILNEVYPAPGPDTINTLASRGVILYHISGLAGRSFPTFPGEYRNAIPCCASCPNAEGDVIVVKLT